MAGAAGVMTLAVMSRATLGHTGQQLTASIATQAIYASIVVAALARICAVLEPSHSCRCCMLRRSLGGGVPGLRCLLRAGVGRMAEAPGADPCGGVMESRRATLVDDISRQTGITDAMISDLVETFYGRVRQDPLLAPV